MAECGVVEDAGSVAEQRRDGKDLIPYKNRWDFSRFSFMFLICSNYDYRLP
jgi:hypothetical protein